ncbi:ABC transporter permease [Larkinella soli]|uniref:ABC transporter permease n=1 Tax=Larkinella soli TaxID=1770527 RepID=UPI000FFC7769|nr:ABC transporter permease [Larkinella soli]
MLTNYLKIAFRTLLANRLYSAINILGLSVGMACCLLITLYVRNELSYDRFHENADSIFRIITRFKTGQSDDGLALSSADLGPRLRKTYPEVVQAVRFRPVPVATFRKGKEPIGEGDVYQADAAVFSLFSYRFLAGDASALDRPGRIVLTQRMARKYFADTPPVGKVLRLNDRPYLVGGVLEDLPPNTDLKFSALISWQEAPPSPEDVFDTSCFTFVQLGNPGGAEPFGRKLAQFDRTQVVPRVKALGYDIRLEHRLQPLTGLHFVEGLFDDTPKGDRTQLTIFSLVAAFLLLVACINYVNLYVAQSVRRQKEVGIRKAVGADRRQLVGQFVWEALLMVAVSTVLALPVVVALRPVYEQLTGLPPALPDWRFAAGLPAVVGAVGLLIGLYPAVILSSARTARVLKGGFGPTGRRLAGKSLVVVQFTLAAVLMAGTLAVRQQTDFLLRKDPGFSKEQVLVVNVPADDAVRQKMPLLKSALAKDSRIEGVALGLSPITYDGKAGIVKETAGRKTEQMVFFARIDESYLDLLKIRLKSGRHFDPGSVADRSRSVIVNESFVKWMGWRPEQAVGKTIGSLAADTDRQQVIGVVSDYHFASLHNRIEPILLYYRTDSPPNVLVRLKPTEVGVVRSAWTRLFPNHPFDAAFLDSAFDRQYEREERARTLLGWFSGLILFIAGLGLFGLAAWSAERRTKEIGIRKVLGATVGNLVVLLSREYLMLVAVAVLIAVPAARYVIGRWLEGFAYRIDVSWGTFLIAGGAVFLITLLTVSFQSVKAALMNPVRSLRSE